MVFLLLYALCLTQYFCFSMDSWENIRMAHIVWIAQWATIALPLTCCPMSVKTVTTRMRLVSPRVRRVLEVSLVWTRQQTQSTVMEDILAYKETRRVL